MTHPKTKGDRTTLAVMLALQHAGYDVLLPFGENTRYDLVIYDGRRYARVQCKTGRLRDGAVRFPTCSSYAHHPNPKLTTRTYTDDVEFFGVWCGETGGTYLVPIEDVPLRAKAALRVTPARNAQVRLTRPAEKYALGRVDVDVATVVRRPARSAATARPSGSAGER